MNDNAWSARTRLIAAGRPTGAGQPLNTPIVGASAYTQGGQASYARAHGTATWESMETVLGSVEGGEAIAFASGMAAIAAVLDTVRSGALVTAPTGCYHGTAELLNAGSRQRGWQVIWLPPTQVDAWRSAAAESDLLWLESPTNPLLEIMDLPAILGSAGGRCRTVVDNTFATPFGQAPLRLGASIVVHSATKYLSGHSDSLAGAAVTRDSVDAEAIRTARTLRGGTPGMLEAFLTTRGMRTLALRIQAASASAATIAERLSDHGQVLRVHYPGLQQDPGHELAASFMTGFGAMVSCEVAGGAARADQVCAATKLFRRATSLGGVESTLERRAAVPGQEHLPPGLIRLSVGCEDVEDLWRDLAAALVP